MAETATAEKTGVYIVMVGAVIVTTGKKSNGKPEYIRVLKGGVVKGKASSEQIKALVHKGAIVKATSQEHAEELKARRALVAREVSQKMGAPDDPVLPPQESVIPARFGGQTEQTPVTPISDVETADA